MSGLTTAAMLSRVGNRVLVLEQHDRCGGGSHTYELGPGYQFDAGLHYTVPWSGPLIGLACDNKTEPVIFDLMGSEDGTFDNIVIGDNYDKPFWIGLKHGEKHMPDLYKAFPSAADQIDNFMSQSNTLLYSTPLVIISKLFPLWVQILMWKSVLVPFARLAGRPALEVMREICPDKKLASYFSGLWIDTGARPDTGTFFLMAAVIRGLPREGGSYPRGGSQKMAMALVETLERNGGRALVKAEVEEINIDATTGAATGVKLAGGATINAKKGVVSSAGYEITFQRLLKKAVVEKAGLPMPMSIPPSHGFVMVNLGFKGDSKTFNIENQNVWYHPSTKDGDIFEPLERYFEDPFSTTDKEGIPLFITFPSIKDQAYEAEHPGKLTCQILAMAKYEWFEKWEEESAGDRGEEYNKMKDKWKKLCLDGLFRFYPQLEGKQDFEDVSTPLSIEHYLKVPRGGAVGLEPTPERYAGDPALLRQLDVETPIPSLWMTGQDTLICGVVLAQAAGVITAFRMMGFFNMCKLMLRNLIHGG